MPPSSPPRSTARAKRERTPRLRRACDPSAAPTPGKRASRPCSGRSKRRRPSRTRTPGDSLADGRRVSRVLLRVLPPAVLALENLAIFFRHDFRGFGFPWDFVGAYYASTAYWTESVARGAWSHWLPYQSMGYPFGLNLQTGLWYLPLWIFPLGRIPYTLHAAVVVQTLHVFLGALGMYVLLRTVLRSRREALIGAFAFQLFGGFYSNAEHVDIVRSFAFVPWLLACLVPPRSHEPALPRRLFALPLFVWATATGGYPGNLIAALFCLACLALLQVSARRFA